MAVISWYITQKDSKSSQFSDFDAKGTCDVIGAWPLRKFFKIFVNFIFLERVFNDEKNDTLVGSLSAILPDLNVSICVYKYLYLSICVYIVYMHLYVSKYDYNCLYMSIYGSIFSEWIFCQMVVTFSSILNINFTKFYNWMIKLRYSLKLAEK